MQEFHVKVITSNRIFFEGNCLTLILPALDGDYGVLAHHEPVVVAINPGTMRLQKEDGSWLTAVVGLGFAQVSGLETSVLVDTVELPEEIDRKRAEDALEIAQQQLKNKTSKAEHHMAEAAILRALSRLKAQSKNHH